jgi:hypothetical protein
MARLRDVVAYLCHAYPHKGDLSKARLTKMVYLADWRSAIIRGHQITEIEWIFNYYGPYVDAVIDAIRDDPVFSIIQTANMFGGQKEIVQLNTETTWSSLTEEDIEILDFVIAETAPLYWNQFMQLVYSTYPIVSQPRFTPLELAALASEYRDSQYHVAGEHESLQKASA